MNCPECGDEMTATPPMSNVGEPMYGRGVDEHRCNNPRCPRFGR